MPSRAAAAHTTDLLAQACKKVVNNTGTASNARCFKFWRRGLDGVERLDRKDGMALGTEKIKQGRRFDASLTVPATNLQRVSQLYMAGTTPGGKNQLPTNTWPWLSGAAWVGG
jgi:hypothetical protein